MFKDEYVPKLKALGIETREDLAEALADEERTDEIHEHLKGVGPKTLEHWREDLEGYEDEESPEERLEPEGDEDEEKGDDEEEVEIEGDEEEEEEEVEIEEEEGYSVKLKPELSKEVLAALRERGNIASKRPTFVRQEYHRRKQLRTTGWRRPKGLHSKMRRHMTRRTNVVSIGYGSPNAAKHLHPSGFREVMVHNVKDLEDIDPKTQAARVAHTVGMRKRTEIEEKADELKIRILNRSG
ncbi:MAG: 50S ribosomal protein L32e [Methanobacteriota archaeon]|nr:MAG: 50S ribosomal protein L32e [Euryarchaeota archaeon]